MKKLLLTTIIASLLILPFGTVAMADMTEAPDTQAEQLDYAPGNVPAETGALDSMTPALHAAILAMVNLGQRELDLSDPVAAWETLYNMLSLYGQMDDRSEYLDEELVLPSETVMDYASALFTGTAPLSPIPEALSDRIRYDGKLDSYLLTCGDDSLAEIQLTSIRELGGSLSVDGSLVYLVDGSSLAQFQAQFARQDNMFGYVITNLTLG
ncbi:hypothetical protein WKS99_01950 [Flintibacter sp. HCN-6482]|uniref:hypothetical protein n=1 Tax=Flintibacter sp. HCN-6482 TaxID=3134672 RepID=UPI0030C3EC09